VPITAKMLEERLREKIDSDDQDNLDLVRAQFENGSF
jgi:hypothetical protein